MKEQLKAMKNSLIACAQSQMGNLEQVDAKELGTVIDMIKDLEEASYYCSITESMEDAKEEDELLEKMDKVDSARYYGGRMGRIEPIYARGGRRGYSKDYYPEVYDPNNAYYMNRGRMYYDGSRMSGSSTGSTSSNMDGIRNYGGDSSYNRVPESRYDRNRRMYSESKMNHPGDTPEDKTANMNSLKELLGGVTEDIRGLVGNMDAAEKATTKKIFQDLATMII